MKHSYTRQRQGRDFSITNYLCHTEMDTECNHKSLFENMVDGIITPEEHAQMKSDYEAKIEALSARADEIRSRKSKLEREKTEYCGIADAVSLAASGKKLTAEIVGAVVDKILVHQGMRFEVIYRFDNDAKEVA